MKAYHPHGTERSEALAGKPLAAFVPRAAAFLIDFAIAFFLFAGLLILGSRIAGALGWFETDAPINLKFNFSNWYSIVFIVFYFGLGTYFGNGKTPGKWMLGIRIVSLLHERISFWHSLERALGYGASALEFGFGFVQFFIHPNRQTVHDRIAETIVIKDPREKKIKKEEIQEEAVAETPVETQAFIPESEEETVGP